MKTLPGAMSAALVIGIFLPGVALAEGTAHEVKIRNTSFQPQELQIDPGDTVTWLAEESDHNVTSNTGYWDASGTLDSGDTFGPISFPDEGTFGYTCTIHNMMGTIKVGDGCDGDCPVFDPDAPAEVRVVPSLEFPTIESALTAAPTATTVELRPGTYDVTETLELGAPGVVLSGTNEDGTTADPSTVVLRGKKGTRVGILFGATSADERVDVRPAGVENLTVSRFLDSGILAADTRDFRISNVAAIQNVEYGIRMLRSRDGTIADSLLTDQRRAGLSIEGCDRCDVVVERVTSQNNFVGIEGRNAGGVTVLNSRVTQNAAGIVLRSVVTDPPRFQSGSEVFGNTVTDNDNPDAPRSSLYALDEALELATGAGIWIQGGWYDSVYDNVVSGNHYGIVVTASSAPVRNARIHDNFLSINTVDLGFDGLGVGVCFSGNEALDASTPLISEPAKIEERYSCSNRVNVGIPYPKVTSDLALYAWRNYYCPDVDGRACS